MVKYVLILIFQSFCCAMFLPSTNEYQQQYANLKRVINKTIEQKLPLDQWPTAIDMYRSPLIVVAANRNFTSLVHTLLLHGANPDAMGLLEIPALYYAAKNHNITMIKDLLSYGARFDIKHPEPLGCISAMMLFDEVNYDDNDDQLAKNCLYVFFFHGMDKYLHVYPIEKFELLGRAAWQEYNLCAKLICKYNSMQNGLFEAAKTKNFKQLKELTKICTVLVKDEHGNNPLHYAMQNDDVISSCLLLSCSTSLFLAKNNHNLTPLQSALGFGKCEILKTILGLSTSSAVVG